MVRRSPTAASSKSSIADHPRAPSDSILHRLGGAGRASCFEEEHVVRGTCTGALTRTSTRLSSTVTSTRASTNPSCSTGRARPRPRARARTSNHVLEGPPLRAVSRAPPRRARAGREAGVAPRRWSPAPAPSPDRAADPCRRARAGRRASRRRGDSPRGRARSASSAASPAAGPRCIATAIARFIFTIGDGASGVERVVERDDRRPVGALPRRRRHVRRGDLRLQDVRAPPSERARALAAPSALRE